MSPFTHGQGAVIRRIVGRGHFRSRDKDDGQTAIAETPLLYAKCMSLSLIQPDLLLIGIFRKK